MKDCFVNSSRHSAKIHCLLVPPQWETISLGLWQCISTFLEGRKEGEERCGRREGGRGKKRNREQDQNRSHLILNLVFLAILASCILGWRYDYQREGNELKKKNSGSLSLGQPVPRTAEMGVTHYAKLRLPCEQSSVSGLQEWDYA